MRTIEQRHLNSRTNTRYVDACLQRQKCHKQHHLPSHFSPQFLYLHENKNKKHKYKRKQSKNNIEDDKKIAAKKTEGEQEKEYI